MEMLEQLEWDSGFFGFRVGRISSNAISEKFLAAALEQAKQKNYRLIYASVHPDDLKLNEAARRHGGILVDEKIVYSIDLKKEYANLAISNHVQEYPKKTADRGLIALAINAGEYSRFKVDKNIGEQKFIELYMAWIKKSVSHELAEKVFIYKAAGKNVGLLTLAVKKGRGSIGLLAINNDSRGQKAGSRLFDAAKKYFAGKDLLQMTVVTQGKNVSACRFYEKCGFSVLEKENFYHFWLY